MTISGLTGKPATKAILAVVIALFIFILLRTAWVGDDAFITLRTVDNFINGYGLVWNVGEKVQTYTHPLWMFALSAVYFFTHEAFFTTITFSIIISLLVIWYLTVRNSRHLTVSLIVSSLLIGSQAFIDYSTSGLENPLTHLLIILFSWVYFSQFTAAKKTLLLSLFASLAMVNRLDTCLLLIPAIIYFLWQNKQWQAWLWLTLGSLPIVSWLLFAWSYYGFIFPNTYYAKLNTGIPLLELIKQGVIYCLDCLQHDPITVLTIITAIILLVSYRRYQALLLSLGSILYLLYVIKNGGDFMAGRFLSAPFILAIASIQPLLNDLFDEVKLTIENAFLISAIPLVIIATSISFYTKKEPELLTIPANGVANERYFYFPTNGLINQTRTDIHPAHGWAVYGRDQRKYAENIVDHTHVVTFPNVGMLGYFAGPKVYIIDPFALTDPFLSHQPLSAGQETTWRVGHFWRDIPEGLVESKMYHQNMLKDSELRRQYDYFQSIVTR